MSRTNSRIFLFFAGFTLWTAFSIARAADGRLTFREGWDGPLYWELGLPLIILLQIAVARVSSGRTALQPLFIIAGHSTGMMLVRDSNTDFGLLPLAILFIGLPAYAVLLLAAYAGRVLAARG